MPFTKLTIISLGRTLTAFAGAVVVATIVCDWVEAFAFGVAADVDEAKIRKVLPSPPHDDTPPCAPLAIVQAKARRGQSKRDVIVYRLPQPGLPRQNRKLPAELSRRQRPWRARTPTIINKALLILEVLFDRTFVVSSALVFLP